MTQRHDRRGRALIEFGIVIVTREYRKPRIRGELSPLILAAYGLDDRAREVHLEEHAYPTGREPHAYARREVYEASQRAAHLVLGTVGVLSLNIRREASERDDEGG